MMPVTNRVPSSFIHHSREKTEPDALLCQVWQQWEQQALPGSGECRSIALERLKNVLSSGNVELDLSDLQLTTLPERFPSHLQHLDVSDNGLTCLPNGLPDSLKKLNVRYNQLMSLPEHLPTNLLILKAGHNQLTDLPACMPCAIVCIDVSHNRLTALPDNLPDLRELNVSYNQLMHISATLLGAIETLRIEGNPLDSVYQRQSDDLLNRTSEYGKEAVARWKPLYQEKYASDFGAFLDKLHKETKSNNKALRCWIANWLDSLAKDGCDELRKQTFLLAKQAGESGAKRLSLYLTDMHILQIEHALLRSKVSLSHIVEGIRGNFRLQMVEDVAARHASSSGVEKAIDIYLAYHYKLCRLLALPMYGALPDNDVVGLSHDELNQAIKTVSIAEKNHFMCYWLVKSALWTAILKRWNADKMAAANQRYHQAISAACFNDGDAQQSISQSLADILLYKERYQLTWTFLAEKEALVLLDQFNFPDLFKRNVAILT